MKTAKNIVTYAVIILLTAQVVGCAKHSGSIQAADTSPLMYQGHSCQALVAEKARIESKLNAMCKRQDDHAAADVVSTTVGIVLFWPALFFLAATDDQKEEIARLKGEYEAVEKALANKKCGIAAVPEPEVNQTIL